MIVHLAFEIFSLITYMENNSNHNIYQTNSGKSQIKVTLHV